MTADTISRVSSTRLGRWLWTMVLLGIVWRCTRYVLGFPLWGDEAFVANNIVLLDFAELGGGLEHYQIVPWLFLVAQWVAARLLGFTEHALRLLPLLAGIAGLVLFARLAGRMLPTGAAVLAVAFLAAAYYPARHAVEVKPYVTDLLVAVLILLAAWRFVERRQAWDLAILGVVTVVGVWASYPAVFVACGAWLSTTWLCWRAQRRLLPLAVGLGLAFCASFVAMFLTVGQAQAAAGGDILVGLDLWARTFPPLAEPWRLPQWFMHVHLGKMFAYPIGGDHGGSALTFILFCLGAVVTWRKDALAASLLLAPFAFTFIAAALQAYPYGGSARVAQHLAPSICALAGAGLYRLVTGSKGKENRERYLFWVLGFLVLIIALGIGRDVVKPYKTRSDLESRRILVDLLRNAPANSSWVVFGNWEGRSDTPNLYDWAGPAARLRYYLERDRDARVYWGMDPAEIPAVAQIKLLVYQSPTSPFPRQLFDSYLDRFQDRWGPPGIDEHLFNDPRERITVYSSLAPGDGAGADRGYRFALQ